MRQIPPGINPDAKASAAWREALSELQACTPQSAWTRYVPAIRFLGVHSGAICCAGPQKPAEWLRSKLGPRIGEVARDHGFAGLRVFVYEQTDDDLL